MTWIWTLMKSNAAGTLKTDKLKRIMSTYKETYIKGCDILKAAGITEYELDARLLLEHIMGTDRNTLLAHPEMEVSEDNEDLYIRMVERRKTHIPLQHITGTQDFMGLTFKVSDKVLVPRQDTECLVEEVMTYAEDGMRVLDMCTGSGCILLSLMHYRFLDGFGCDYSEDALAVAKENARMLETEPRPIFLKSDMFSALGGAGIHETESDGSAASAKPLRDFTGYFDIIVSNPPYIRSDVIPTLMDEVRHHDPMMALDGGVDGLDFYRIIAEQAPKYLTNYGRIFLEIGYDQGEAVSKLLMAVGFTDVAVKNDYSGNPRVVIGTFHR